MPRKGPRTRSSSGNLARMKSSISSTRAEVRHWVGRREARRPWPRAGLLVRRPTNKGQGKYQSDQLEETTPREVRPGGPRSNRVRVSIGPIGDASSRFPSSLPAAPSAPRSSFSDTSPRARARRHRARRRFASKRTRARRVLIPDGVVARDGAVSRARLDASRLDAFASDGARAPPRVARAVRSRRRFASRSRRAARPTTASTSWSLDGVGCAGARSGDGPFIGYNRPRLGRGAHVHAARVPAQAHRHLLPVLPARHVQDARRRLRAGERPPLRPLRGPRGRRRGVRPRLAAPRERPDRLARKKKLTRTAISSSAFQIRSAATRCACSTMLTPTPAHTSPRRRVPRHPWRPPGGRKARPSRPSVHRSILPLLRRRPAGLARRHALARRRGGGGAAEKTVSPAPAAAPRRGRRSTNDPGRRSSRARSSRSSTTREAGVDRGRRADPELAEEGGGAPGAVLQLGGRVFEAHRDVRAHA